MARLDSFLTAAQQREIEDVRAAAEVILRHPLDHTFTDHTITHPDRIREHLDVLLAGWAEHELALHRERTRAEIFILLAAVYLHDIGMQFQRFEHCPSLGEHLPTLLAELARRGIHPGPPEHPFSRETLNFARQHHHLLTYDWVMKCNRRSSEGLLPFESTGLRSHVDLVARIAWSHNVWLTNEKSYAGYEHLLANAQEQEGEVRMALLAAFLRLGDILDMDKRRVPHIERLRSIEISAVSRAHWWRHHFVRTWRLDERATDVGRRLHVTFGIPREHAPDLGWLKPALCSATVAELEAEQLRLTRWIAPAAVWIKLPSIDECEVREDASGLVFAMATDTVEAFRRIWPGAPEGAASQARIQNAVEEGALTGQLLGEQLRPLGVRAEIDDYLKQVGTHEEQGFRDTPYTPIELDYGDFTDALDALQALLDKPDPHPRPRPIVLVGDPGGGKTTLVRRYVLDCARGLRTPQYLPIYVQINRYGDREWAEEVDRRLGTARNPAPEQQYNAAVAELVQRLLSLLAETVCDLARVSYQHRDAMLRRLSEMMARKSCLIVLDGLNESPPLQRGLAIHAVRCFVEEYPSHRVVVTSRRGDYHEDYFSSSPVYTVQPLQESAVRAYWDKLGVRRAVQDKALAPGQGGVAELAANPMYMYMLGELMKGGDAEAVRDPGLLFQMFTRETLRRWHRGDASPLLDPEEMEHLLADVAFHALRQQAVSFNRDQLTVGVDAWWTRLPGERQRAIGAVGHAGTHAPDTGERSREALEALLAKMLTTGLLQRQGQTDAPRYVFRHHTTQDYFAATAIGRDIDVLPTIVGRAIFHEALRIVPGIVPDPNEFVRRLTASTSHDLGRANLLPLCFRVAGAVQAKLRPEVTRQLLAGVLPLFHAAVVLQVPYAAEVMGYLFSQVGWQALGRFLAEVTQNLDLMPTIREFAAQRLGRVLTRDDPATAEAIGELLGEAVEAAIWADHRSATLALDEEGGEEGKLRAFPLLLGGITSSVSLTVGEKLRIVHSFGRLTPNQLGMLQMIFIEETNAFGTLAIVDEKYNAFIVGLYTYCRALLLLRHEDELFLQGEIAGAVADYLAACSRVATRHPLFERLVLLSAEMSRDQVAQFAALLRAHRGEVFGRIQDDHFTQYSTTTLVLRRVPRIGPSIRALLGELQAASSDPWLVLWSGAVLKSQQDVAPRIAGRAVEIASALDWKSPSGLLFLDLADHLGGDEVQEATRPLRERYYPERPSLKIERLKGALKNLPVERVAQEALAHVINLGFHDTFVEAFFSLIVENFDLATARQFIEEVGRYDQALHFKGRILLATKLATERDREAFDTFMSSWGVTLQEIGCTHGTLPLLRAVFSMGDHSAVLDVLGWQHGQGQHAMFRGKAPHVDMVDLTASLLEEIDLPDEAFAAALAGIDQARATGSDPQPLVITATRIVAKLASGGTAPLVEEARALLNERLLSLLGDPANTPWVAKQLEALRRSGDLDMTAYAGRLGEVLRSSYAHLSTTQRSMMLNILSDTGHHDEVLRCLDAYVCACPRDPAEAASYLGSGAFCAYLAGDDAHFRELTEAALALAPEGYKRDWLLGNRALAFVLAGQREQALATYAETRSAVADRARWHDVAVEDLEQHAVRRPGAEPVSQEFIEAVRALGADLPEPPPAVVDTPA